MLLDVSPVANFCYCLPNPFFPVLSAKAIKDRDPVDQRMPPASRNTKPTDDVTRNMRNVTSSSVLLPGSVLMLQKKESDPSK